MRFAGLALLGFLLGAMAGLLAAFLLLFLWYDLLGIGDPGGDHLNGLAALLAFGPLGALAGGLAGAFWFVRKSGGGTRGIAITAGIVLLILAAWIVLGPMFLL